LKFRKFPLFLGTLLMIAVFGSVNVYAVTRSYLSRNYDTPDGMTMFSDVNDYGDRIYYMSSDEDKNIIKASGNAKIGKWQSDIEFVMTAPELQIHFEGDVPANTEFEVRLTNLKWFFRNSGTDIFLPRCTDYFTGGIELLFPTSYNSFRGKFMPDDNSGLTGVYTRERDDEVDYRLYVSEDNVHVARVVLMERADANTTLKIPLVTLLTSYADAKVEIVPTMSSSISPGVHTVLTADKVIREAKQRIPTTTTVPNPMSGIAEIPIPEIVITENIFGIIDNGALVLTAPEGFALLPNVDNEKLKTVEQRMLNMKNEYGEYVVNAHLTGGLKWKSMYYNPYQQNPEREKDIKFYYRNPPGFIDTNKLVIEFKDLIKSTNQDQGAIIITGLKLVPLTDDYNSGDIYVNISPYLGLKELVTENFLAGIIDSGVSDSAYMKGFNIDNMPLAELIKTPEFKAKIYITHINGALQPGVNITRGQLCEMIYELLADTSKSYTHSFTDVKGNSRENAIAFCAENGYVNGYENGSFLPNGYIKRGEFAVILNNILKLNANTTVEFADKNHFAYEAIKQLVHAKIMQGYGNNELGQENLITKQEAVAMINRAFDRGNSFTPSGVVYSDISSDQWSYGDMMNAACGYLSK